MGIFVTLSSGVFTMGAPVTEPARQPSETQHVVTLSGSFEMQTTEVSQEQFQAVLGYDPSTFAGCATCPVETVTWHEAAAYCNGLSGQAGFPTCFTCSGTLPNVTCDLDTTWATPYACTGFRLPTEAEWEYAARAGTTAGTYNGTSVLTSCETPNPVLDPIAWYCGNATFSTQAAGGKAANPWGLYDMLGNVWEWVHDWSDPYPGNVTDPWGPATGSYRVFRGGSFGHEAQAARAAARAEDVPSARVNVYGFRPVRSQ